MKRRKLLITTDTYFPKTDGVLIFLERVIPYLTDDYDVTIAAPVFDKDAIKPIGHSKVVGFPLSRKLGLAGYKSAKLSRKNFRKLKNLVKEADIIWSQDLAFLGAFSIYYGHKFKKPVFNYVHQITWEQAVDVMKKPTMIKKTLAFMIKKFVNYMYNRCTVLMVPYKELALELEEKGATAQKVIITLGVDTDLFKPAEDKYEAKQKLGFDPKVQIIGYCGRISPEKNLQVLKKAFSKLQETYKDTALLIVGGGLQGEIDNLKKVPNVKITGFVRDVVPYLQAMDVFVMPSLTETTSLATIEAMSCGLPVIATKVGYIKDYIVPKFNGLFFGRHNDYVLMKKIESLLISPGTRHLMGTKARKTVEQKFEWDKTISDIKKAFDLY